MDMSLKDFATKFQNDVIKIQYIPWNVYTGLLHFVFFQFAEYFLVESQPVIWIEHMNDIGKTEY